MKKKILVIVAFCAVHFNLLSQKTQDEKFIQFSGVVVTGDSLKPIPFANVMIRHTYRGSISDFYGFFTLVASLGDTIEFSNIGYKKAKYVIPDTLSEGRYSLIQMLYPDTIQLHEAVIHPWPTREQFKDAFLALQIPDDQVKRAERNIALAERKEFENPSVDPGLNYKFAMQEKQARLYYAGQLPTNNLLNPIAWAKFIQAWRNGDFKRKDEHDDEK